MSFELERRKLFRGFRSFAIITVVAFVLLGVLTTDRSSWDDLARLRPAALPLLLSLVFVSWFATALKVQILASGIGSRIGVWSCFRAHLANMFLSAVTPFQTGGGPVQVYVLWREGLSISRASAASLIGALITVLTLFFSGIVVLLSRPSLVENLAVRMVTGLVIVVFGAVLFLFWVGFFKPAWVAGIVRGMAAVVARAPLTPASRVWRVHDRLAQELADLIRYLRSYLTESRGAFALAVPLGVISVLANYFIAHAVLFGMRISRDPLEVLLAQILIYFIIYFSPSPGGSGVAEAGGASLMAALVPTHQLAVYVVLWRLFSYLIGVGLGAFVVVALLRGRSGEPAVSAVGPQRSAVESVASAEANPGMENIVPDREA